MVISRGNNYNNRNYRYFFIVHIFCIRRLRCLRQRFYVRCTWAQRSKDQLVNHVDHSIIFFIFYLGIRNSKRQDMAWSTCLFWNASSEKGNFLQHPNFFSYHNYIRTKWTMIWCAHYQSCYNQWAIDTEFSRIYDELPYILPIVLYILVLGPIDWPLSFF